MIQVKPSESRPAKARLPTIKEQNPESLIFWAAYGLERCAERFGILAKLSHGIESRRWRRMATNVKDAAAQLRIGSGRHEELRRMTVEGRLH